MAGEASVSLVALRELELQRSRRVTASTRQSAMEHAEWTF